MPMLEWNDSLSINFSEIDEQHKNLITMINNLYDIMTLNNDSNQSVHDIISDLHNYTIEHFGTEEKFMEKYNFPEAPAHISEHKEFISKISEVENLCSDASDNISMDILNYLSTWIVQHINDTDKKMGEFINNQIKN
ncbi:bacteriohemerythrin [Desulfovibrio sp. UCD-KL4C]|uniref:bacteriohemerythrin n=1 Tax=Desulfovibrio sp. UCD-KL4C TaxID=2578120 RepID=UPI0025C688DF|nr:bacteriohemerythrin [Desulfovibrio sp. UCD-KL4C]